MNKTFSFLLEIGSEELPASELLMLSNALNKQLCKHLDQLLVKAGFGSSPEVFNLDQFATPRRLAMRGNNIPLVINDAQKPHCLYGPKLAQCFDAQHNPSKAALGFAAKQGIDSVPALQSIMEFNHDNRQAILADMQRQLTKSSDNRINVIAKDQTQLLVLRLESLPKLDKILIDAVNAAIKDLPLRQRMRWGDKKTEFCRPVKWVCLLMNQHHLFSRDKLIATQVLGVETSRHSYGHPFMQDRKEISINIKHYPQQLRRHNIIVRHEEREAIIRQQVQTQAEKIQGVAIADDMLYKEVAAITEYPHCLHGSFDKRYLSLPNAVLIEAMQKHQRYFPVRSKSSQSLLNTFIFIADNQGNDATIIKGNERVIKPRLEDAQFFYQNDLTIPLEQWRDELKQRMFYNDRNKKSAVNDGSMHHKIARLNKIAPLLSAQLLDHDFSDSDMQQACEFSKIDLQSALVGEFAGLQGMAGAEYVQHKTNNKIVSAAIKEHYQPRFAGDTLPTTPLGMVLALSDRLDNLFYLISKGKKPSASSDPFALRRAALGIVRIIAENKIWANLDLKALLAKIPEYINATQSPQQATALTEEVFAFIMERIKIWLSQNKEISQPFIQAVFNDLGQTDTIQSYNLHDSLNRLEQLQAISQSPDFIPLVESHKRIVNILQAADHVPVLDTALLQVAVEKELHQSQTKVSQQIKQQLSQQPPNYDAIIQALIQLVNPLNQFFDNVMVNVEDKKIRNNRLALLAILDKHFRQVANFSLIDVKNQALKQ